MEDYEDVKLYLEEAQDSLKDTQEALSKLQIESKQKEEKLRTKLDLAVKEAKEESKEKERQTKMRVAAEQRLAELEWYFLPLDK